MKPGIYDALVTQGLLEALQQSDELTPTFGKIDEADQPEVLSRHLRNAVFRVLEATRDEAKRVVIVQYVGRPDELCQVRQAVFPPSTKQISVDWS
jgi:hypothetical protein